MGGGSGLWEVDRELYSRNCHYRSSSSSSSSSSSYSTVHIGSDGSLSWADESSTSRYEVCQDARRYTLGALYRYHKERMLIRATPSEAELRDSLEGSPRGWRRGIVELAECIRHDYYLLSWSSDLPSHRDRARDRRRVALKEMFYTDRDAENIPHATYMSDNKP